MEKYLDLRIATECISVMKESGTYRGQRIGILRKDVYGLTGRITGFPSDYKGKIVLFREELYPSDSEMRMGEYMGMKQKPTGKVTIESPLSRKWIDENKQKGSLITTIGTMIGVPLDI